MARYSMPFRACWRHAALLARLGDPHTRNILHIGDDVKQYVALSQQFRLEICPHCGERTVSLLDWYARPVPCAEGQLLARFWRYRCHRRACRCVTTVLPDCLLVGAVYPASVRDFVAEEYLSGRSTYEEIATAIGCSKSTAWRWMRALTLRAAPWLQTSRAWLGDLGLEVGPLVLPEHLRRLWDRRRIRAEGMLSGLLFAGALAEWVEAVRAALRQRRARVLPGGLWAFGCHVLNALGQPPSQQTERCVPP